MRNAFLIRDPAAVLASYVQKREAVELADIGIVQQRELFEREAQRLGAAPPVVESNDVLADPARVLAKLCAALGIAFTEGHAELARRSKRYRRCVGACAGMPRWSSPACFTPPPAKAESRLPDHLRRLCRRARPHYERC